MPVALGYTVLVEMDKTEEKVGSIILTSATRALDDEKMEKGTILQLGPLAFKGLMNGTTTEPWVKPGDRVFLKSYGGRRFRFKSGRHLRLVNDEDCNLLISPEDEDDELL